MYLYLSGEDPERLKKAESYLEERLSGSLSAGAFRKSRDSESSAEYEAELSEEAGSDLLGQLLETFPDLNISGTFMYDLEGRDHSFWGTTRYQSAVDEDGKHFFEVSSSTNWA